MIPARPPPTLQNEANYSKDFVDFLTKCLQKNPDDRLSAAELLEHPFVKKAKPVAVLMPLVNQMLQRVAAGGLHEKPVRPCPPFAPSDVARQGHSPGRLPLARTCGGSGARASRPGRRPRRAALCSSAARTM